MYPVGALWPVLFITFISIVVLITMDNASTGIFIFFGCVLGLLIWHCTQLVAFGAERINISRNNEHTSASPIQGDIESNNAQTSTTRIVIARVRAQREPWHDVQLFSFAPRAHVARLAIRALPPVTCFCPDHDDCESQHYDDCPICMEEFKNGELIQPFGPCVHQFHSSCINSWLLGGNITCPVCRKELSITIY